MSGLNSLRTMLALVLVLALAGAALIRSSLAQTSSPSNEQLLALVCDRADINGATCAKARNYPVGNPNAGERTCEISLNEERYSGRFFEPGKMLLVIGYASDCEPHANNYGGSAVFQDDAGSYVFRGYHPGYGVDNCVTIARGDVDRLFCITGALGQGYLESRLAELKFARVPDADLGLDFDFYVEAQDSEGAYTANVVDCRKPLLRYFSLSDLKRGPALDTLSIEIAYADAALTRAACAGRLRLGREIDRRLLPKGHAFVPSGQEKTARFILDLRTRKLSAAEARQR